MSPRFAVVLPYRSAGSRLARFVTGSMAAHGLLVAGILFVGSLRPAPQSFDDAMVVALAGPIGGPPAASAPAPSRPAAAPAPAPPPPKAPEPKEAHTVKEVPKPKASPPPKKKEEPPKKAAPETGTENATPGEAPSSPVPSPHPGTGGGGNAAAGPTGVTATLGGGDASLGFYGASVKAALEAAWTKPYLEEQGDTYSATVSFVIARDGTARDVKIVTSSGVPSLDRSAMRAVIEASPFPPIPSTWQGDTLPATMRFDLTPEGR
jgi:protein TonB